MQARKPNQQCPIPFITGINLESTINNYHALRGPFAITFDQKPIHELQGILNKMGDKTNNLTRKDMLNVAIILLKVNPTIDILTSSVLSDMLPGFDLRVLSAIKAVLDLGGLNDGTCLVDCLELMFARPDDALKISLAKSTLNVLFVLGAKSELLAQYNHDINTNAKLASDIFCSVVTLGNFGYLFKNPQQAEAYFREHMPTNDNEKVVNLSASMFRQ